MRKNEFYQISKLKPKKIYIRAGEQTFEDKNVSYYEETYSSYAHAETNGEFGDCRFEFEYEAERIRLDFAGHCMSWYADKRYIDIHQITLDVRNKDIYFEFGVEKLCDFCNNWDAGEEAVCRNIFKNGNKKVIYKIMFEYDEEDLIKAALLERNSKKGKGCNELIEEKTVDESKNENSKSDNGNQEDENMAKKNAINNLATAATIGEVAKGFDLKAMANDLGIEFGINPDSRVKSTLLGTVFEYEDGRYRGFDRSTGVVTDYASIKAISLPSVILPATSVKVGDMILRNNEFYFITKAEKADKVCGANITTLKEETLLPVANPIGIKCYTRLISLGEVIGFKGETNQNTKIMLWIATILTKKLFEEGIDNANQKIMKFSDETGKYMELLFPFAAVAFASYAIKGKDLDLKKISETVKNTFGFNMPELNDKKNIKRLAAVGLATSVAVVFLKTKLEEASGKEEVDQEEAKNTMSKVYDLVKPYEKTIKKVLPLALAICAVKLFNGGKIEEIQDNLEGVLLIAEDTISEKFGIDEDVFTKENIKKFAIVAGVAVVAFSAYGKKIKGEGTAENAKFTELLKVVAPILPVVVVAFPQLKKFFLNFINKDELAVDDEQFGEEDDEE